MSARQGLPVAVSVFLGAVVIAIALYFGLSQRHVVAPSQQPLVSPSSEITPTTETSITQIPTVTQAQEVTWTKTDLIAALSAKTGIPEAEIKFSTGEEVDQGNTKLLRGTVSREGEMGGGGFFAVVSTGGVNVTYTGQGVPLCSEVNPYGYPLSWADYCIMDGGGNTVRR